MDLSAFMPFLASIMLHMVRVGAFMIAMHFFGSQRDSRMARLVLGTSLALILWWVGDNKTVDLPDSLLELGVKSLVEGLIGFGFGFVISLIAGALAIAGEMVSHDMGFAMSQVMNPVTGQSSPVMSQFFQTVVLLIVFALDLHHQFLRVMAYGFELLPIGVGFDIAPVFLKMTGLVSKMIELGTRYALPIMGVLVVLTAMLVMLARAVQNINLLEFSFGLRILLGMFASTYFLSHGTPFLIYIAETMISGAADLFVGA